MGGSQSAEKRKGSDAYEEEEITENRALEQSHHVELGDQNAVRNIMDDAIVEYCQGRKDYVVHYGWDNVKLILMVVASTIAAASHFYRTPAITERTLIYMCVIGFFVIHALLLAYTVFVERDILVRMTKANNSYPTVVIKTSLPYTEPSYKVEILLNGKPNHVVKQDMYIGNYFDAEGYFDKQGFEKEFKNLLTRFETRKAK